jgi:hypothetical protein
MRTGEGQLVGSNFLLDSGATGRSSWPSKAAELNRGREVIARDGAKSNSGELSSGLTRPTAGSSIKGL